MRMVPFTGATGSSQTESMATYVPVPTWAKENTFSPAGRSSRAIGTSNVVLTGVPSLVKMRLPFRSMARMLPA